MTASRVQGSILITFGTSTNTVTLSAPATVGNIVVVGVRANNSVTINTPTDDKGHTYSAATAQINSSTMRVRMFYAVQTTGGMTQVTVTTSANAAIDMAVEEYAGVQRISPLGNVSNGTGTTETNWSVTSFSPTATGNLIVAFGGGLFAGGVDFTAGSNYTLGLDGITAATEHRLSSAASETAPLTAGTAPTAWAEVAAEFKAAVAITATISGTGTLSASVTIQTPVAATISGAGNASASVTMSTPVAATVSGAGNLSASLTLSTPVEASLSGTGAVSASVTIDTPVAASLSGVGSQSIAVTINVPASAALSGAGNAVGAVDVTVNLGATLSGTAGTGGEPTITTGIVATLSGTGTLRATFFEAAARGVLRVTDALKAWLLHSHRPAAEVAATDTRTITMRMTDQGE